MNTDIEKLRITSLRKYLFSIIDDLVKDKKYQINANMLSNDINNYSLDKIPTASTAEKWITGLITTHPLLYQNYLDPNLKNA